MKKLMDNFSQLFINCSSKDKLIIFLGAFFCSWAPVFFFSSPYQSMIFLISGDFIQAFMDFQKVGAIELIISIYIGFTWFVFYFLIQVIYETFFTQKILGIKEIDLKNTVLTFFSRVLMLCGGFLFFGVTALFVVYFIYLAVVAITGISYFEIFMGFGYFSMVTLIFFMALLFDIYLPLLIHYQDTKKTNIYFTLFWKQNYMRYLYRLVAKAIIAVTLILICFYMFEYISANLNFRSLRIRNIIADKDYIYNFISVYLANSLTIMLSAPFMFVGYLIEKTLFYDFNLNKYMR